MRTAAHTSLSPQSHSPCCRAQSQSLLGLPLASARQASTQLHGRKRQRRTAHSAVRSPTVCVTSVGQDNFDQSVLKEKGKTVLVDFWASWCGPCKLIDPFMKQVEEEFTGKLKVVKVEADPNPQLVEKYKVYGLPTLILFKDGSMVKGSLHEGAITKPALLKYLSKYGIAKEVAK